ncbi:dnaJ-like protein 60 [Spodoptera litura]|uniref:DnaJ-like protein 60 n=1 Tax=Spodoptera litura TaxID=69820 RepID=A0A9J7IT34_SPOLT|nr:dnaJ-like protein 60 [Spodoptera litura]
MFFFKRFYDINAIKALLRCYSLSRKNHYEVLNLRRNCSDKEIKEAFIQMSKEFHPDKNKDVRAQEKFVRILEAYNVLGKPNSRAQYDNMIEIETSGSSYMYRPHVPHNVRKNPQYSSYYETYARTSSRNENTNNNYYGVSGVKKLPNYVIIAMCTGVALIGVFLQVFVIRNSYVAQRKQAQEKSQRLAEELDKVRAAAQTNGNELQTRLLLDKIVAAANPTVATASLGQALANEKKTSPETFLTELGLTEKAKRTEDWSYTKKSDSQVTVQNFIKKVMSLLL